MRKVAGFFAAIALGALLPLWTANAQLPAASAPVGPKSEIPAPFPDVDTRRQYRNRLRCGGKTRRRFGRAGRAHHFRDAGRIDNRIRKSSCDGRTASERRRPGAHSSRYRTSSNTR